MKEKIHPKYHDVNIVCACGTIIQTASTQESINVEICSKCHPFFTGKQKFLDTEGRIERFNKKYEKMKTAAGAASAAGAKK